MWRTKCPQCYGMRVDRVGQDQVGSDPGRYSFAPNGADKQTSGTVPAANLPEARMGILHLPLEQLR